MQYVNGVWKRKITGCGCKTELDNWPIKKKGVKRKIGRFGCKKCVKRKSDVYYNVVWVVSPLERGEEKWKRKV